MSEWDNLMLDCEDDDLGAPPFAYEESDMTLYKFVVESNRIENINREPHDKEIEATKRFLQLSIPTVTELCKYVGAVADAKIRDRKGMDVLIGLHRPPPGGPNIPVDLYVLLANAIRDGLAPFEIHRRYETLHPFMDGNGRSGRVLWAWQMTHHKIWPVLRLNFLHEWYYQSLSFQRN